jgi:hypothetical protein
VQTSKRKTNLRRLQTAPVLDMEAKLLRENSAVQQDLRSTMCLSFREKYPQHQNKAALEFGQSICR